MSDILAVIGFILLILWLIGYIGFSTALGNFIHILLVLAVISFAYRLFFGRR